MRAMYHTNHAQNGMCVNSTTFHMFNRYITIKEGYFHFWKYAKMCKSSHMSFCAFLSEPVPLMNSDTSGDKYEGMLTTSGEDAEVLRTWLQRMCCALVIPASSYFRGLRDREMEVRQRLELPEGRGDRGGQRGVCRKYSS